MSLAAELPIFQACPWQHGNQGLCIYSLRKSAIAWYCHCTCHIWSCHICFVRYIPKASYVMSHMSYVFWYFVLLLHRRFCKVKRVWAASLRFNDNYVVVLKSSNCGRRSQAHSSEFWWLREKVCWRRSAPRLDKWGLRTQRALFWFRMKHVHGDTSEACCGLTPPSKKTQHCQWKVFYYIRKHDQVHECIQGIHYMDIECGSQSLE